METSMRPYVVVQGDHLPKLAARYGFDPDEVWNHAKNEPLRRSRADYHMLLPGDVLHLPEPKRTWHPVKPGVVNTFVAPRREVSVVVRFLADGAPLAGETYVVVGAAVEPGTLDGEGYFRARVPARLDAFTIQFPARNEHYTLKIGHLHPPGSATGLRMRLGMLGFYGRGAASCANEEGDLTFGLRHFQHVAGAGATGEADDTTVAKITEKFGR